MVLAVLGGGLLVLGLVAVATGILPAADAAALGGRIAPVLGFVVAITIVAAIAAEAGLFDRLAATAARVARGRGALLWLLVVVVAVASTVFLSLDTTAVLLTPVVVTLARRVGLSPIPFALTTVWLANTGSLLLPVSNLTNLLAESDPAFGSAYIARSWLPATIAVLVPVAILAVVSRKALAHRYEPPAPDPVADPVLFRVAAVVVALLVPALAIGDPVLHVPVWVPATIAAAVLVVVAAVRKPSALSLHLLPVPLVLFVCGLFLAVTALGRLGLTEALTAAAGTGEGPLALLRLAGVGTVAANLADNLPAYLALEPVAGSEHRLLALLVAVNAGPLITPWASLATLLWHARLRAADVEISWWRFAGLGLIAAPLTVGLATLSLLLV
ncbi:SLC13 family permease [Amnibacterium setariae]|uniref:Arsenic transporter n=1 Tax=Amnibacterium setariae TaxID=2306585 RepID=A0A3A1U7K6_9MICO|nr:SLC13 family permease [Amnibacterium setariae]RIX31028.1 arsenic transporter [Amnibacterium setariae]